jgi:hypothetical protein
MQKTICSIFFQPLKANRPFAARGTKGFNHTFEMPAAEPKQFHTLVVDDVDEMQRNGSQQTFVTPVYADALAECLISEWRANKIANEYGRPGIFVCAGSQPTDEELARERNIQTVWCEKLVNEAEGHWVKGDRELVSQLHREAAKWLGREAYDWVHNTGQAKLTACPFCATKIDEAAIVCRECRNVINLDKWTQAQTRQIEAEHKLAELRKKLMPEAEAPKVAPPPPLQPNAPKQAIRT